MARDYGEGRSRRRGKSSRRRSSKKSRRSRRQSSSRRSRPKGLKKKKGWVYNESGNMGLTVSRRKGKVKAFLEIRFPKPGMIVRGVKLVDGDRGFFLGMPSRKVDDDEYVDYLFFESSKLREGLVEEAADLYKEAKRKKRRRRDDDYEDEDDDEDEEDYDDDEDEDDDEEDDEDDEEDDEDDDLPF